jgi:hypothetical protein
MEGGEPMKWIILVWGYGILVHMGCLGFYMVLSYQALSGNKTALELLKSDENFNEKLMHAVVESPRTAIYSILECVIWPLYWPITYLLGKKG